MSYRLYGGLPDFPAHKTYALIHTDALAHNFSLLRETVRASAPAVRTVAVVKADAYGHGAPACVQSLLGEGCDAFAVSCIEEAVQVRETCTAYARENGIPGRALVLILGYTLPTEAAALAAYGLTQALLSADYARLLSENAAQAGVCVHCHVALDTGMNRIGFPAHNEAEAEQATADILHLGSYPSLAVDGLFSHFSTADDPADAVFAPQSRTREQYARYRAVLTRLERAGARPALCHICNSAASVRLPEMYMDGVRLGILLYGVCPSPFVPVPVVPVMELCTVISHVHTLLPGEAVSYGGCFSAGTPRTVATLPIGYADGFLRAYSGASVTVHTGAGDFSAPVIGRICMDQCMIDITDIPAVPGDTVTLFGERQEQLCALASLAGTIPYESLCLLSARVPRLYVR